LRLLGREFSRAPAGRLYNFGKSIREGIYAGGRWSVAGGISPNSERYAPAKRPKPLHPQAMQIDRDELRS